MKRIDVSAILADKTAKEQELDKLIHGLNETVKGGRLPSLDDVKEQEKNLSKACQWLAACELVNDTLAKLKTTDLSDEQVKIALCKARFYTTWTAKQEKTGYFTKKDRQVRFDVTELLEKFNISTDYTRDIALLGLYLTLAVSDLVDDQKKNLITGCYKLDKLARQKFETGVDPLSKRQSVIAVQAALDSFLPSVGYKAINHDWNFFMLAASKRDKKSTNGIKMVGKREMEEIFYDYIENLARHEGVSAYSVIYKTKNEDSDSGVAPMSDDLPKAAPAEEKPKAKSKTAKAKSAKTKEKAEE